MARYSASAEEGDTTGYFLVFQEIGLLLSMIKYPVVNWRVMGQLAQSESEKAESSKELVEDKRIPAPGEDLM